MSSLKMIISIVPHDKGEKLTRAAMESGCQGGTVLMGRSLAKTNFAAVLGLDENAKDMILMIVEEDKKPFIIDSIKRAASREKRNFGELFTIDVNALIKGGKSVECQNTPQGDGKTMSEMITVIVNKGYADDVMAAARKAGAGGGTVLNARGTARENDERFFGMHIVPEKEMLIIVVPKEKKSDVLSAIQETKCLKEPGMGIAYSSGVEDFCLLGKK